MSHSIYRVKLPILGYQEVNLTGPPIWVAADRGGDPQVFDLWFEHYDESAREMHRSYAIYALGTGNAAPWTTSDRGFFEHLGSLITTVNQVWHVYLGPSKSG